MSIAIVHLILKAMNNLLTEYLLANGIMDDLIILLDAANIVHSAWELLMCHLLLSSSGVADECLP